MITKKYPSQQEYYNLIKKLQDYIATNGASPANYPMLNIAEIDSNNFVTTVAIPVNKVLPDTGPIVFKKMFPGNILTAEVKGGVHAIEEGFRQLNHYVSDYQLVLPAIPFQSLITDRLVEADTSKWMTKLYYPIY
jgi:effector-binding domain-containing protein